VTATNSGLSGLQLGNSLRDVLPELVVDWAAAGAPDPSLVVLNHTLAAELGLDPADLAGDAGVAVLSGNAVPPTAQPSAMAYAGHQFGGYSPLLGDGRALLLGELTTPSGATVDLHLKGSGRTPFARGGDGKAALGPMLREYLMAEAMHALGVSTTRSLAVVRTGEQIYRDGDGTGAILARTASSHLRVGTFEYAARLPDASVLQRLADYAIARHYPGVAEADDPYMALLGAVAEAQAALIAEWMVLGFIHGVMNTDNMTISGETIDYGPCAFMDRVDPATVFSSIDHGGRYRYGRQPQIAQWNLARFAETLLRLHDDVDAAVTASHETLDGFQQQYDDHWNRRMRAKLGLVEARDDDAALFAEMFAAMETDEADLTMTFRRLADHLRSDAAPTTDLVATPLDRWRRRWHERVEAEGRGLGLVADELDRANPLYIPRNHLVEEALTAAADGDTTPFERMMSVVTSPFEPQHGAERYAEPAPESFSTGYRTFCGT
jgi:uncharacterized protein YdiU (UPF0061 family)